MGKIHAMMDMGKRSMMNSQTQLQTTAHNIANRSTEGYSRQRVDQVTAPAVREGRLQLGMGSRAATVSRISNPFLDKQLAVETGKMGFLEGREQSLLQIEQVFNEQVNRGLNHYVSDFFNSFRELANNPESTAIRTAVRESAEAMAKDFSRVNSQLEGVQKDIDLQLQTHVEGINKMVKEIADLNNQVVAVEQQGIPANDQRDRREVLLKKLNEKIDIKVAEGDRGAVMVTTAANAILVSGSEAMVMKVGRNPDNGRNDIIATIPDTKTEIVITDRITGGQVGGILEVRDKTVGAIKSKIDGLAYSLATAVNEAHVGGYDRLGRKGDLFFKQPESVAGSAGTLSLHDSIKQDVTRIVTAAKANAPGDASVANVISLVQYKPILDDETTTLDDFYNAEVGRIGVLTHAATKGRESQGHILMQTNALRDSISGVNMDEEATKMIEFQKTFDASARLISTADEMFDTVLSLKR